MDENMEIVTPERDQASGKYAPTYTDAEFVEALRALGGEATSSEVADELGCVRDSAYRRLSRLAGEETVSKRRAGRTILWSLTEGEP
jgi:uncharacterized membrane protein